MTRPYRWGAHSKLVMRQCSDVNSDVWIEQLVWQAHKSVSIPYCHFKHLKFIRFFFISFHVPQWQILQMMSLFGLWLFIILWEHAQVVVLYCYPACASCPTHAIEMGLATWAICAAIQKYSLSSLLMQDYYCTVSRVQERVVHWSLFYWCPSEFTVNCHKYQKFK